MNKGIIFTDKAPRPVGPYSQAVKYGGLLFISGQLPNDPKNGEIVSSDLSAQTKQALKNVLSIAEANGMTKENILKVTVFLRDIENYSRFNEAYAEFLEAISQQESALVWQDFQRIYWWEFRRCVVNKNINEKV